MSDFQPLVKFAYFTLEKCNKLQGGGIVVDGILFVILISIGLPIGLAIYALVQKKFWPFVLGVIAFVGSQILIRLPILQLLEAKSIQYTMFSATRPILFAILLALSAGVVEEVARYVLMRYLLKERSWQTGFLFGAGHGGIEAFLLVGIGSLVMIFVAEGTLSSGDFIVGGIERLFTIILHIGLSLLVLRSVVEKRVTFLILAIFIHTFVNSLAGIIPLYFTPTVSIIFIEVSLALIALALLVYHFIQKRKGVFQ